MLQLTVLPKERGHQLTPRLGRDHHHKAPTLPTETGARAPDLTHAGGVGGASLELGAHPRGLALLHACPPKVTGICLGIQALQGHRRGQTQPSVQTGESVTDKPGEILIVRGSEVPDPTQRISANGTQGLATASGPLPPRLHGLVDMLSRPE